MIEKDELIVKKNDVFEKDTFAIDLEYLGQLAYPFASVGSKLYAYRYTVGNTEQAKEAVSSKEESEKYVIGIAVDLRRFLATGELCFDEDGVGIWFEETEVPEIFRKAFEEKNNG